MNHKRLGAILECMESALLSPEKLQMYGVTRDEVREAFKWLEGLVERDTPKETSVSYDGEYSEAYCPNCHEFLDSACIGDFCTECGQRLDWSEYWSE